MNYYAISKFAGKAAVKVVKLGVAAAPIYAKGVVVGAGITLGGHAIREIVKLGAEAYLKKVNGGSKEFLHIVEEPKETEETEEIQE